MGCWGIAMRIEYLDPCRSAEAFGLEASRSTNDLLSKPIPPIRFRLNLEARAARIGKRFKLVDAQRGKISEAKLGGNQQKRPPKAREGRIHF